MDPVIALLDKAQKAAEAHLAACNEWLWWADSNGQDGPELEPDCPAVAPYCGCDTCVVREILAASWVVLQEASAAASTAALAE